METYEQAFCNENEKEAYDEMEENMSGYQRMVSYIYRYDKGIKGKNAGYARIEQRAGRCRITIRLQDMVSVLPKVSFFIQNTEGRLLIPAGTVMRSGGALAARIETSAESIMNSEYSLGQIDGLFLQGQEDIFYATVWKDIEISPENGMAQNKDQQDNSEKVERQREKDDKKENKVEEQAEQMHEKQEEVGNVEENDENMERKDPDKTDGEGKVEAADCIKEDMIMQGKQTHRFGERILSMFPQMYPFEIAEMGECVRLDLKDIGNLPVAYWSLAGNPFLLKGYYCYRHLIFTRLEKTKYAVGVPGIFSEENERWAKECRMERFQPLSQVKNQQGAFGYWLYPVSDRM